jgi:Cdc6-like AAA superfamily ATPase
MALHWSSCKIVGYAAVKSSHFYGDSSAAVAVTHGRKPNFIANSVSLIDVFSFLYVYGPAGTGKSHIIQDYCAHIKCLTARVDCVGTSTIRCVFESLLNQLARHVPCEANSYTNYCRCDDMSAFVHHLKKLLVCSCCIV